MDDNGEPEPISGRMNDIFGGIRAQVKSKEFHKSRKPISRLTRVSLPKRPSVRMSHLHADRITCSRERSRIVFGIEDDTSHRKHEKL